MIKQFHVHIRGKVQGVFYRLSTKAEAESLAIKGWVRNKVDGSVEAVFQGDEQACKTIIQWCKQGPAKAVVQSLDCKEQAVESFEGFEIR